MSGAVNNHNGTEEPLDMHLSNDNSVIWLWSGRQSTQATR